ncbi:Fms-interacting protein-domain-containing protein [Cryomyces antarcticus]
MAAGEIVTDPILLSVLSSAALARQQCLAVLHLLESYYTTPPEPASHELQIELSKQQKLLYAHVAQLRGLNRRAILGVRETKAETAERRQEIDRLHLQLQNLYYEQRHLAGEIAACEDYDHKYQSLPLIPVPDFLSKFPEHASSDEPTLMTARINHEHAERQALEEQRQGLLKKKQALIAENKKRKDDLASLDKDLEKFIDAAKPIQKIFEKEY